MEDNTCPATPPRTQTPKPPDIVGEISPKVERESPEPNCAICLGKTENKSFTDSCLHQFCFNCLLQWSKVKAECPLCKQSFKSIIHNVRSNEDYDQYHLHPHEQPPPYWPNVEGSFVRFRYRTTVTTSDHHRHERTHESFIPPFFVAPDVIPAQRSNRRRARVQTAEFRAQVYRNNMWVNALPDITGRHRECSPEFFRNNPSQAHRLVPWLNRELNVLRIPGPRLMTIIELILQLLQRYPINSLEFRTRMTPYIGVHTSHFLHEFYSFATSPYDMIGFDESAIYDQRPYTFEVQPIDSDSDDDDDDDDVVILPPQPGTSQSVPSSSSRQPENTEHAPLNLTASSLPPRNQSPVPGPSGYGYPVMFGRVSQSYSFLDDHMRVPIAQEDSTRRERELSENDSDDCVIVGYVKPRHERTPEVITLDSDPDVTDDRDSYQEEYNESFESPSSSSSSSSSSSPTTSSDSSDSDFVPCRAVPKGRKIVTRKRKIKKPTRLNSDHNPPLKKQVQNSSSDSETPSTSYHRSRRKKLKRTVRHKRSTSDDSSSSEEEEERNRSRDLRKLKKVRKSGKEQWRIIQKKESSESSQDYSHNYYEPPYTEDEITSFASGSRPKLRSIIITKSASSQQREQSHSSVAASSRNSSHGYENRHHKHKTHRREEKKRR